MNKRLIGLIIAIVVIAIAIGGFVIYRNVNNDTEKNVSSNEQKEIQTNENINKNENNTTKSESRTLVVYYSAQSHTKSVAETIANNLNADIFEIVPEKIYTNDDLDWRNSDSRVSREHNDETLRNVDLKNTNVDNWENYDTVLIGYPIWWGIAAWPVDNFVKDNNFDGKTVIPFCTSASSGLGQSGKLLQKEANSGNWQDGHRFSSSASDSDIKKWTDSLE